MNKHRKILNILLTFPIIAIFFLGIYFTNHTRSSVNADEPQAAKKPIRIDNKTQFLEVTSVERVESDVRLSLKNNYDKTIAVVAIAPGDFYFYDDLLTTGKEIVPGATRVQSISLYKEEMDPKYYSTPEKIITILAVVFDDKTGDGDPRMIRVILGAWEGEKEQTTRMLPLFKSLLTIEDAELPQALGDVKSRVQQLSDPPNQEETFDRHVGSKNTRDIAFGQLEQLENIRLGQGGHAAFRKRLIELMEYYEKRLAQL